HVDQRLHGWGKRDDPANVQVAIGPSVEPAANPGSERIIHSGVTERALNAYGLKRSIRLEESCEAHDGPQLQQHQGYRRIIEIHFSGFDGRRDIRRNRAAVDLQAERQRHSWTETETDAAEAPAFDGPVQFHLAAPERFIPERVESEDLSAAVDHGNRMIGDGVCRAGVADRR